ncbi:glycine betaine ABC transporter substrate-binding protein [Glycomyces sp. TRM65418]|uniref:glycine betaine ABC transporter substrate-binding protein n=1 Tax=Glycomyces sp. TRM65418 TaxID=2867006 RepID=UPI001CE69C76|nr:glycine betaine ABC transporter substrate-binding protein [Glycomyces sp. TRM65418]MCC3764875.1 glycine betaine ABC transporter substrate-binding protein [Glycomyces sp. TRM65418]QZD54519.1 glycine betaine ABC transporter substrate-binding protein [Glycomyces sp. TRM65418]
MQRRLMMKSALGIGAGSAAALALSACSVEQEGGSDDASSVDGGLPEGSGTIDLAVIPGWDEGVVATELWRQALTGAGYTVNVQEIAEAGVLFEALASGDIDLFLDGWLPVTHKSYMDEYGDRLEQLGAWNENAALTVAVPAYVDVNSLTELNANADLFGGKIVGIEPSAGLTEAVQNNTIPTYGMDDLELQTSSTATMLAELDSAIAAEEPIVVTLWQPHWAYAKYDLKNLEDPEGTLGDVETLNTLAREGFSEEFGDVAAALESFKLSDEQLANLENTVFSDHEGDVQAGVSAWLEDNEFSELIA